MARPIGYPGFYPGDRIPRRPASYRSRPHIPNEYNLDAIGESIQGMEFNFGNIPGFVKDELELGIRRSLSVNLYARHLSAEESYAYATSELAEERGELSGVTGISVSLDPQNIAKDPKKWAGKVAKNITKELVDWGDMELKKRGRLWEGITGLEKKLNGEYRVLTGLQESEIYSRLGRKGGTRGSLAIADLTSGDVEIGKAVAIEIVDFQSDINSALFRDSNFDSVLSTTFNGASVALKRGLLTGITAPDGTLFKIVDSADGDDASWAASFVAQTELANTVGKFTRKRGTPISRLGAIVARLNQTEDPRIDSKKIISPNIEIGGVKQKIGDPLSLDYVLEEIRTEINKARAHLRLLQDGVGSLSPEEKKLLGDETINFYSAITLGPILSSTEAKRLQPQIRKFEESLQKLEGIVGGDIPTTWVGRNNLVRKITVATMDLGGGTFVEHGVERAILREIADTFVGGAKVKAKDIKRLEDMFPEGSQERDFFRNLRILLPTLERDRFFYGMDDFIDTLYSDSVLSTFLWAAKIDPRLKNFTPDHFVQVFMEKMNYFGLNISDENLIDAQGNIVNPKFFLFKWMNKFIQGKDGQGRKIFLNTFSISTEGLGISAKKLTISGGKHFDAIEDAWKVFQGNPELLTVLLKVKGDLTKLNPDDYKNILKLFKDKLEDDLKDFAERFQKFCSWLETTGSKLGLDPTNGGQILEFINKLRLYNADKIKNLGIGITTKYRGVLQWVGQKVSILQNKIFKSALGKVASKVIGWEMVVSHAISTAITGAIAALTGGVSTFASGAIEKAIQFVVRIVLDNVKKLAMVFVKADFEEFDKFMEKSMYNLMKWLTWAVGAICAFCAITMLPIIAILAAFTPLDNAKIGPIGSGGMGQGGGGGGGGGSISCSRTTWPKSPDTAPKTPLSPVLPKDTGAGPVANYGYDIVDELRPGFWCYWNYSPQYSHLFDLDLFQEHPNHCVYSCQNPTGCTSPGCPGGTPGPIPLFWCSYLTYFTYETQTSLGMPFYIGARHQARFFGGPICSDCAGIDVCTTGCSYISAYENVRDTVKPGDAVFFVTGSRGADISHVGMVYKVTPSFISIIESNSWTKTRTFNLKPNGSVDTDGSGGVVGFGHLP